MLRRSSNHGHATMALRKLNVEKTRAAIVRMLPNNDRLRDWSANDIAAHGALTRLAARLEISGEAVRKAWRRGTTVRQLESWAQWLAADHRAALVAEEERGMPRPVDHADGPSWIYEDESPTGWREAVRVPDEDEGVDPYAAFRESMEDVHRKVLAEMDERGEYPPF
jgi:hypothetical protein